MVNSHINVGKNCFTQLKFFFNVIQGCPMYEAFKKKFNNTFIQILIFIIFKYTLKPYFQIPNICCDTKFYFKLGNPYITVNY